MERQSPFGFEHSAFFVISPKKRFYISFTLGNYLGALSPCLDEYI